jgi:Flp pilus assembly protein TadB
MSISNYEGPRGGDYARYVDELLRASPLHQRLGQVLEEASRSDFSGAVLSPGAQSGSVLTRLRERAQAAVVQAQEQAQQQAQAANPGKAGKTPTKAAERKPGATRQSLPKTAAPAAGQRNPWFRLTPGRVVGLLILAALSVALPGLGVLVLLFAIINAVRRGIRSASESA